MKLLTACKHCNHNITCLSDRAIYICHLDVKVNWDSLAIQTCHVTSSARARASHSSALGKILFSGPS